MPGIVPITLTSPGRRGLNLEHANELLSSDWSIAAENCVLNRKGRVAARKGWSNQTTGAISGTPAIDVLFEYLQADGTATMISAANNKIYKDVDDYTDANNDITPTTTPTGDDWQFVNFNGKVVGFQDGHQPIVWSGSGDFADISEASGTAPTGNAACAAFGRIWAVDSDKQTLQYCGLLDETEWDTSGGGGSIDLRNVWTNGIDEVVAIAAFGANLIVFGKNHIIFYADDAGSTLGVDPDQLYVVDTIEGTGCIARDSIQAIGEGDLAYLSRHGIQLLGRVVRARANPTATISKNIRTHLADVISTQTLSTVRSTYSPENGFYLLAFPGGDHTHHIIGADMRFLFQDEDGDLVAPILEWSLNPTSLCTRNNGDVLFGFAGEVGKYSTNLDDTSQYRVNWSSPWLELDPQIADAIKIFKELPVIAQISATSNVTWAWEFDFSGNEFSKTVQHEVGNRAEWGEAEYNVDEFSGGLILQTKQIEGRGEGQFFRVGVRVDINGFDFVIQQIRLLFKLGRITV